MGGACRLAAVAAAGFGELAFHIAKSRGLNSSIFENHEILCG